MEVDKAIETLLLAGYSVIKTGDAITSPHDVKRVLAAHASSEIEQFFVITLDTKKNIINKHLLTQGTLDHVGIHARDVFRHALTDNAHTIILAHNHPSGNPQPSQEDIDITKRMIEIGTLHGIPVLDHVIVATQGFVSLREETYLWD